jgi:hypothetical protein
MPTPTIPSVPDMPAIATTMEDVTAVVANATGVSIPTPAIPDATEPEPEAPQDLFNPLPEGYKFEAVPTCKRWPGSCCGNYGSCNSKDESGTKFPYIGCEPTMSRC